MRLKNRITSYQIRNELKNVISNESSSEKSLTLVGKRFLPSVEMTVRCRQFFLPNLYNLLISSALIILLFISANCTNCPSKEEMKIPQNVIEKSNQKIISKTGEDFFKNNLV